MDLNQGRYIVVAGTPGTGKSTISALIRERCGYEVVNLSQVAIERGFIQYYDDKRVTYVIDEEKLVGYLRDEASRFTGYRIIQTHYPEIIPRELVTMVFVLRTNPLVLEKRLLERGWNRAKVNENVMAEILGVVAHNARSVFGDDVVYELDTTDADPVSIAETICQAIKGLRILEPAMRIDWLSVLAPEEVARFEEYVGSED